MIKLILQEDRKKNTQLLLVLQVGQLLPAETETTITVIIMTAIITLTNNRLPP